MGLVAMTYKVNPNPDVDGVDANAIAETIRSFSDEVTTMYRMSRQSHLLLVFNS